MKRRHHLFLGLFLLSGFFSFAQQPRLWLKSGPVVPEANINAKTITAFNNSAARIAFQTIAVIQFAELPSEIKKKELENAGIRLLSYIPDNAYVVSISKNIDASFLQQKGVRALFQLTPKQKMDAQLSKGIYPAYAVKKNGSVDVRILLLKNFDFEFILAQLTDQPITILSTELKDYHIIDLRIATDRLEELASLPFIEFVQARPPKEEPLNNNSRTGSRANVLNASIADGGKGLNGEGVTIGIGDNANIQLNADFSGRILASGTNVLGAHGVHVSGTATGAGIVNEWYRGYVPRAKIVSESFSNVLSRAPVYVQDYNMVVTNNSYGSVVGCGTFGIYESSSAYLDNMAFTLPKLLNVFAAGNSGNSNCPPAPAGFHTVLGGFQAAKNVLTVGNTTDSGLVIGASSKGPVLDGRIKPEIAAMGTNVISNWATNFYLSNTGTSMAAPAVSGGAALLYQRYRQLNGGADPQSALIKSLLCNGAADRGPAGPDYSYGFGWMNLLRSIDMMEKNRYYSATVAAGATSSQTITVPANTAQLKVMLYWHDPAASPVSSKALVNDLDLELTSPAASTTLPFVLDTSAAGLTGAATRGADHLNNIEQIVIDNPASGNYTINVKGTSIPVNAAQSFFVVYDMVPVQLKLTSPIGGEAWAPGEKQKIHWEADGFSSGTVAIDYSTDNGATWNNIASGININRKIFSWDIPNVTGSEVKIKISREGGSEVSTSNAFTIIGIPSVSFSATQCESYAALNWAAVTGATDYEVFQLNGESMIPVGVTTSTSYNIGGLSPDSVYWVGVTARVNGKNGRRSYGIARQPNTGSCTGSISDNDLKLNAIISPKTGRKFTSTELTTTTPVTIQVKNLDDVATTSFKLRYALNGGAWVEETVSTPIAPGGTLDHTFSSTLNLSAVGTYNFKAEVINNSFDPVAENNLATSIVRQLDNQPVTLGFSDNLEAAAVATYNRDTMGLFGVDRYDFTNSLPIGRLRTFVNTGVAFSGTKAFSSESSLPPTGAPNSINEIIGTFNLAAYNTATNDVRLDFRYLFTGQTAGPLNNVWVRGNDSQPWLEVFSYAATGNEYKLSPSIEMADSMLNKGQNFSSSFQVKWSHQATSTTIHRDLNFSVDDIRLLEVFNDMQMLRIDSPATLSCGLNANVPLVITIRNSHNAALINVPVKYSINNGPVQQEIIPTIPANTTIQFSFANKLNLGQAGIYTIKAYTDFASDSYRLNDTLSITIQNAPLVTTYPYLQNFESGDGGYFPTGNRSSWEFGTPNSIKINKAASGSKAWKTKLSGNYNDMELSYLYSPCFNLTGLAKPTLSFSTAMDLEDCGTTLCDGMLVEYSTDGKIWKRLDTFSGGGHNWYNKTNNLWSVQNYTNWHVATCALPVGFDQFRFRFVFFTDEAVNYEGVAIDDIHVYDNKGIYDGVTLTTPIVKAVLGNNWTDFDKDGKLVASILPNNQDLGNTSTSVFINKTGVRNSAGQYYHDRNLVIQPTKAANDSVSVRFYFLDREAEALLKATGCASCTAPASAYELGVSKYSDIDKNFENGTIDDDQQGIWDFIKSDKVAKVPYDRGYYAEFKVKDFSEFWLNGGGLDKSTPLPVKLLNFTVQKSGNDVIASWTTANEAGVSYFDIEVAIGDADLQANRFVKIGRVNSKGNSSSTQFYNFTDTEPFKSGLRYYRLKTVNDNGSFRYSPVRSVLFTDVVVNKIFPNPSDGIFYFIHQSVTGDNIEAVVYDSEGRKVGRYVQQGNGFVQNLKIDLTEKASGLYLLQVKLNGRTQAFKLNKK